ncbi:MAG: metallophosphoesterase [Bacteroidetes bacterium HGW-Bacteroidetes-19]|nr:MAG: metallophosphoesterase [Bacteroidetes bacterium HGW-Bacteroidetes-20]PKP27703.1 MAG: metallophosphoesterase [Bacteroidetes bacterium HGW-Bacteroidetes-19]
MKNYKFILGLLMFFGLTICMLTSCEEDIIPDNPSTVITPLNNGTKVRNLILVISDIHLGVASYQECNANRIALVHFLQKVRNSPNVKELVIAGDFLDEWFVPANIDNYQGTDQTNYVDRIVLNNQSVFNAFNNIIQDGNILLTYVPGNHDLTITEANINRILPGVNQSRDVGKLGLGSYSPENYPEIVIEHGHRYNFFCAPDPFSNQDIAPGTILPPGYFFTRIAALHVVQGCEQNIDTLPIVTVNGSGGPSQSLLYKYWYLWAWAINELPVNQHFDDDFIITNLNGLNGSYSINDLIPYQKTPGGTIQLNLYNGIQDNWESRCIQNNVNVPIPTEYAIVSSASATGTDTMAYWQYFNYPISKKRIVIFGHSHDAKIKEYYVSGQKNIYANTGTWIDHNPNKTTMNFIIVTPQDSDPSSSTFVRLYNFEDEKMTKMNENSLRF